MKMYIVAAINDMNFDTENEGTLCTSYEEALATKKSLESQDPETKYTIWEIN